MKTIVLLHGWGSHPSVFDELGARLALQYDVHTPSLCGYGGTPAPSPYTVEALAAAVAAETPERCHVAGWSLGGQVALAWARLSPRQIARLVLFGTTPCFVRRADWNSAMEAGVFQDFSSALARDAAGALIRFVSLQSQDDMRSKSVARRLRECLRRYPAPQAQALAAGLRLLSGTDLRGALGAIANDALIVHGDRDRLVPLAAGEYLARVLPSARCCVVPGAAHAPFLSDPDGVSRSMLEFLDG